MALQTRPQQWSKVFRKIQLLCVASEGRAYELVKFNLRLNGDRYQKSLSFLKDNYFFSTYVNFEVHCFIDKAATVVQSFPKHSIALRCLRREGIRAS